MAEQGAVASPFTERWNGSAWKVVAVPSRGPGVQTLLTAISCASPANCWAVGYAKRHLGVGNQKPVAEHWQGKKWSPRILPKPKHRPFVGLTGVSCSTVANCWAVGFAGQGRTVVERWNGKRWSIVPDALAAKPGAAATLTSVSCVSDSNCWAAGTRNSRPLAEHWQGKKWSIASTPGRGGFDSISRLRAACLAVGIKPASSGSPNAGTGRNGWSRPLQAPTGLDSRLSRPSPAARRPPVSWSGTTRRGSTTSGLSSSAGSTRAGRSSRARNRPAVVSPSGTGFVPVRALLGRRLPAK
jgi:hypothetical protein